MRVLIVNPPIRAQSAPNNVPLGIYHVGNTIRHLRSDYEVKYIDLNAYRPEVGIHRVRQLLSWEADVLMVSGLLTTYAWQKQIIWMYRAMYPKAKIILGGGLASNLRSKVLEWFPVDAVCVGEFEPVAGQMLYDLENDNLDTVYRGKPPKDLDALPGMRWQDVQEIETYIKNPIWGASAANSSFAPFTSERSLSFITSRGCPRACKFCNRDILGGRKHRMRSAKSVVDEAEFLKMTYNIDFLGFIDDNFAVSKSRLKRIAEGLGGIGGFRWGGHPRFDEVDDPVYLKYLHQCGCVYLGFGGESANPEILKDMDKGNKPEQMARVLAYCREAKIHPNTTWMMNWPGETREQIRDTVNFILEHAPENRSLFCATAYPNTALFTMVKDKIWSEFGSLKNYVEQLADATKPMINYTEMKDSEFWEVVELVKRGEIEKI